MNVEEMMKRGYYTSEENAKIIERLIIKNNRVKTYGY